MLRYQGANYFNKVVSLQDWTWRTATVVHDSTSVRVLWWKKTRYITTNRLSKIGEEPFDLYDDRKQNISYDADRLKFGKKNFWQLLCQKQDILHAANGIKRKHVPMSNVAATEILGMINSWRWKHRINCSFHHRRLVISGN